MNPHTDHTAWQAVAAHLEQRKHQVDEEIRRYPAPIPACDAQFNHLMAQRAQLTRDLGRLATASKQPLVAADAMAWLDAFADSLTYLDEAAQQVIRRIVFSVLPGHETQG